MDGKREIFHNLKVKRGCVLAGIVIVCFLIQCMFPDRLTLGSIQPNLFMIVTASFGFMRGKREGMLVGFACGLLLDIFSGALLGFYAVIYLSIGYSNGCFHRLFFDNDIKLPLALISSSDLAYGLVIYFTQYVLRGRFDFFYYLNAVIFPELVYTVLVTLLLYQVLLKVNQWLKKQEERRESKFV